MPVVWLAEKVTLARPAGLIKTYSDSHPTGKETLAASKCGVGGDQIMKPTAHGPRRDLGTAAQHRSRRLVTWANLPEH
jgi:hypothetical protein